MKHPQGKVRILLVCNNVFRDLPALKLLKLELKKVLGAEVIIVGSVTEIQRTYYLIFKHKPHIVFLYQVQEQVHRDIAQYIKNSGGIVCVVPTEVSIPKSFDEIVVNKNMSYNKLIDYFFFPGKEMYRCFQKYSDIKKNKLYISGSPKFDVNFKKPKSMQAARKDFCSVNKIPTARKNIFILTSFYSVPDRYVKKDIGYSGNTKKTLSFFHLLVKVKQQYIQDIKKLCNDFSNFNIILKLHPLEETEDYEGISSPNFFLIKGKTIQECLPAVDLAIHWSSTAAMECWLWSKKTIQYNPVREGDIFLSDFSSGNPLCHNFASLKSAIKEYLVDTLPQNYIEEQRKFLEETFGKLDGHASREIARVLKSRLAEGLPSVNYKRNYSPSLLIFFLLEKIIGQRLTGRLIKFVKSDYQADYAVQNRIPD